MIVRIGPAPLKIYSSKEIETKKSIKYKMLKMENKMLKIKLKTIKANTTQIKIKNKYLALENSKLEKKIQDLEKKYDCLTFVFSPKQIELLEKNKAKIRWSEEDISRALALRCKSISTYQYLRTSLNIPLPGISTLKDRLRNLNFDPGNIIPMLQLMKHEFQDASAWKRYNSNFLNKT